MQFAFVMGITCSNSSDKNCENAHSLDFRVYDFKLSDSRVYDLKLSDSRGYDFGLADARVNKI